MDTKLEEVDLLHYKRRGGATIEGTISAVSKSGRRFSCPLGRTALVPAIEYVREFMEIEDAGFHPSQDSAVLPYIWDDPRFSGAVHIADCDRDGAFKLEGLPGAAWYLLVYPPSASETKVEGTQSCRRTLYPITSVEGEHSIVDIVVQLSC